MNHLSNAKRSRCRDKDGINDCHFAIAKLCFHCLSTGDLQVSSDLQLVRMFVFNLMGRLQRGNESMAAVLFSQDVLYQANGNPLERSVDLNGTSPIASPIPTLFLGELCGSDQPESNWITV